MSNPPNTFVDSLLQELKAASQGEKNSIKYLKTDLTRKKLIEEGQNFQVIMVGGSHLETVLARFEQGQLQMLNFKQTEIKKLVNRQIFFDYIEQFLQPMVSIVALNFAYPIQPLVRDQKLDGKLIGRPKGHVFEGLYLKNIGEELEKYFLEKGRKIDFTVCNDTTALGLASLDWTDYPPKNSIMGVVGTGFNFGLFENEKTLVNLEMGNFDQFKMSRIGEKIDAKSNNFGQQRLEKEVGGGYLFEHFNIIAREKKLGLKIKNTKELSTLLETGSFVHKKDGLNVYQSSSKFVARTICALYKFKQWQNQDQDLNLLVLIEGSLYWKAYQYKSLVQKELLSLGMDLNKIKIDQTRKIGLKGAANLVLAG